MSKVKVELENKTVLITGAAGFIGAYLAMELLKRVPSMTVVGLDNMNDYYEVSLKGQRLRDI